MATETSAPLDDAEVKSAEPRSMGLDFDRDELKPVIHRIKRAQGQLAGVVRMLEEGRGCEDVVTQLAAVSRALDRVGFALIAQTLEQCLSQGDAVDGPDVQKLEKLFLSLA